MSCQYITDVTALNSVEVTVDDIKLQGTEVLTYCKLKLSVGIYNPTHQDLSGVSAEFDVLLQIVMLEAAVFQKVLFLHSQTAKKT